MSAPDRRLATLIEGELRRLYPDGGSDPIAAGQIATAIQREGWRRITAQAVEVAMKAVPNLGVEAYPPTIEELTVALLAADSHPDSTRPVERVGESGPE